MSVDEDLYTVRSGENAKYWNRRLACLAMFQTITSASEIQISPFLPKTLQKPIATSPSYHRSTGRSTVPLVPRPPDGDPKTQPEPLPEGLAALGRGHQLRPADPAHLVHRERPRFVGVARRLGAQDDPTKIRKGDCLRTSSGWCAMSTSKT